MPSAYEGTDIISCLRSKYIIRLAVHHIAIAIYHYLCEFNLMKIIRSLVVCATHYDYVAKVKKVFSLKLFVFVL